MHPRSLPLPLVCLLLLLFGCDSNGDEETAPLQADRIEDIAADPTTGRDPVSGAPVSSNRYTFVSLRSGSVVLAYSDESRADSASTAWDIGFQGTTLLFNGGDSGPGVGAALLLEEPFDSVLEAPSDEQFRTDGISICTTATGEPGPTYAVCPGSDNGWYHYNPATNVISPIAGRTLVVRTADGRFAKVRVLSYYHGNPPIDGVTAETPSRYYSIEYVFQEDGTRRLESL